MVVITISISRRERQSRKKGGVLLPSLSNAYIFVNFNIVTRFIYTYIVIILIIYRYYIVMCIYKREINFIMNEHAHYCWFPFFSIRVLILDINEHMVLLKKFMRPEEVDINNKDNNNNNNYIVQAPAKDILSLQWLVNNQ